MNRVKEAIGTVMAKGAVLNPEMLRESLDTLSGVGLNWHPEDPVTDICWTVELDDEDIRALDWFSGLLFSTCQKHDLDPCEEMMNADVRAHGKASPFYREDED